MTALSLPWPVGLGRGLRTENMGGPRSRTRKEQVKSSLLGRRHGVVRCPRIRTIGFSIDEHCDPVAIAYEALARAGCRSPEDLRTMFEIPREPCLVAPSAVPAGLRMGPYIEDDVLLSEALVLGLCAKTMYDPRRPVVWTRASLSRRLDMFRTGGFYALD